MLTDLVISIKVMYVHREYQCMYYICLTYSARVVHNFRWYIDPFLFKCCFKALQDPRWWCVLYNMLSESVPNVFDKIQIWRIAGHSISHSRSLVPSNSDRSLETVIVVHENEVMVHCTAEKTSRSVKDLATVLFSRDKSYLKVMQKCSFLCHDNTHAVAPGPP